MTRRYTAAEARELAARAELEPWAWDGAAPDLAATVCALEAERDALRAAAREYVEALEWNDFHDTTETYERLRSALAALREAAK